jgi:hypothetical protein
MIVTFYSYKGGVGRSMALVNVGEILADRGFRVIVCDWDLEAPGLENYLVDISAEAAPRTDEARGGYGAASDAEAARKAAFRARTEEFKRAPGIMDLLDEYKRELKREGSTPPGELPPTHQRLGLLVLRRPSSYAVPVASRRPISGSLRVLTAGQRGGAANDRYTQLVRSFDWSDFYDSWGGAAYFEFFRQDLVAGADVVLIDSRTGVTEQGGVCTHHLADLVVLLSAPNDLNVDGTRWMAEKLKRSELVSLRGGRPLEVLPVAARVEIAAETELLSRFRGRFAGEFAKYLPRVLKNRVDVLARTQIPYVSFYSFEERVVAREYPSGSAELFAAYSAVAEAVIDCGVSLGLMRRPDATGRAVRPLERAVRDFVPLSGPVFVSYSRRDSDSARAFAAGLRAAGVEVWMDELSLQGSQPWASAADDVLRNSVAMLILVGATGLDRAAQAEAAYAVKLAVTRSDFRVVPILLPGASIEALPADLARFNAIDVETDDLAHADFFRSVASRLSSPLPERRDQVGAAPLPGLRPFGEELAPAFFGRDSDVTSVTTRLGPGTAANLHWAHVEGLPGVGKSSFVHAGLIPAIRRGAIAGTPREWRVVSLRVGSDPLLALASALKTDAPRTADAWTGEQLRVYPEALADYVGREVSNDRGFLLVVDHLEELFVTRGSPESVQQFDALLAACLRRSADPFYLITTLRSDLAGRLTELPQLAEALKTRGLRYELPPLSENDLRAVLLGSARLAGVTWETGLPERIIADSGRSPVGLPLVAVLLPKLWERRSGSVLTHEAYVSLGGILETLARTADLTIEALSPDDRERSRKLLLAVVTPSGARQSVSQLDAVAAAGGGAEAERVIDILLGARLLLRNEDGSVTLAHDALVSHWPKLAQWLVEERETLRRRQEVDVAARAWIAAGRPPEGLPTRDQLKYYERAGATSADARQYLAAAHVREQSLRRRERSLQRWVLASIGVSLLVLGGVGIGVSALATSRARAEELLRVRTEVTLQRLLADSLIRGQRLEAEAAARRTDSLAIVLQASERQQLAAALRADSAVAQARRVRLEADAAATRAARLAAARATDSLLDVVRTSQQSGVAASRRADSLLRVVERARADRELAVRRSDSLERELAALRERGTRTQQIPPEATSRPRATRRP